MLVPLDDELVVRLDAVEAEQHALDLAREDVDAADDEHVVGAAEDARHARERPPAHARLPRERREVAGAVAQQRERLLRERREHELADLAVGNRRAGLGIDRLDEEVVLVDVRAAQPFEALGRYAGADDLREPVVVDRGDVERFLDRAADPLRPRLGAADRRAELQARHVHDVLADRERVARRAAEDLAAEVLEQLRMARRVAARGRDDGAAEPLGAVVEPEPAGEEAVPVRDVDERPGPAAGGRDRASAAVGPEGDVVARVRDDRRLAARPRRGVDADALLARHAEHPERVRVAQLGLRRERLLGQGLELDPEARAETLALEALELGAGHRLQLGLEDHDVVD